MAVGRASMSDLNPKQQREQDAFRRFIERYGTKNDWESISSRPEPEPDLLCIHRILGEIAFELVSLTDPTLAESVAAGTKNSSDAFTTSDPSERVVRKKLHSKYVAKAPRIELLIYSGRLITPDEVVISTILPWFDAIPHQFKKVWFMGELTTDCIWSEN